MSLPRSLIEAVSQRKVVPFIGAGVSLAVKHRVHGQSAFPSWENVLKRASKRLREEQKEEYASLIDASLDVPTRDLLYTASIAKFALGPVWNQFLQDCFSIRRENVDESSLRLPKLVWDLGSALVLTTNYDRVLRWACPDADNCQSWNVEAKSSQSSYFGSDLKEPIVWHLHGSIDDPSNIILTDQSYRKLYDAELPENAGYSAALASLRMLLLQKRIIFIGYGLGDEDLVAQLSLLDQVFDGSMGPHFALVRRGSDLETIVSSIKTVEPISFNDFGEDLENLVEEISSHAPTDTKAGLGQNRTLSALQLLFSTGFSQFVHTLSNKILNAEISIDNAKRESDINEVKKSLAKTEQALDDIKIEIEDEMESRRLVDFGEIELVDVSSVFTKRIERMKFGEHKIKYQIADECTVIASEVLLTRVFKELINNSAVACGRDGEIEVSCKIGSSNQVLIIVSDDGPGMDEGMRKHAFKGGYTTRSGHSGMGLRLAKTTVNAFGGRIFLEDSRKGGLQVTISLPFATREEF